MKTDKALRTFKVAKRKEKKSVTSADAADVLHSI